MGLWKKELIMKINKIDHICIAVKDLEAAKKVWEPMLGKSGPDDAYVDELEKINVARYWVGEDGFELMQSTAPDGDVAKFIAKNGEGVMLISFNVDNTREAEIGRAHVWTPATFLYLVCRPLLEIKRALLCTPAHIIHLVL